MDPVQPSFGEQYFDLLNSGLSSCISPGKGKDEELMLDETLL